MHHPSSELVAVAWAKTVPDVDPTKVATSLPGDTAGWASTGFVTATVVGGDGNIDVPLYEAVVAFDCWAVALNSNKAPWGHAGALAAAVQHRTYRHSPVTVATPDDYYDARLLSTYAMTMPRRIPSDGAGFARVQVHVALVWSVIA